jgi:hypothetical protein
VLVDAMNDADMRTDTSCTPPAPDPGGWLFRLTVVGADTFDDAITVCDQFEPGTTYAYNAATAVIGGTADTWICFGGVAVGDCIPGIGGPDDLAYLGPIDSIGNAEYHNTASGYGYRCGGPSLGSATIVTTVNGPPDRDAEALAKCQDLGFSSSVDLNTDGYSIGLSPDGTPQFRCFS